MSGGVDSSVATGLLVEQGFDVVGITIKTYKYEDVGGNVGNDSTCCSLDGINDARRVALGLGIPHYTVDFTETFKEQIINYFVDDYLQGNTPNPCVRCNERIKFAAVLDRALALDFDAVATGHYAQVVAGPGGPELHRGVDPDKDQSYVLGVLTREQLGHRRRPESGVDRGQIVAEHGVRQFDGQAVVAGHGQGDLSAAEAVVGDLETTRADDPLDAVAPIPIKELGQLGRGKLEAQGHGQGSMIRWGFSRSFFKTPANFLLYAFITLLCTIKRCL